jgi:type II secretory pathway pseudopilin PulG
MSSVIGVRTPGTHRSPGSAVRVPPASDWRLQAAIVFGLELAHLLFESVRTDHALLLTDPRDWLAYKGDEILRQSINVITAVAALQLIDRLPTARPHRTPMAWLAMLASGLTSASLAALALPHEPVAVRVGASASTAVWFWYTLWVYTMIGGMALVAIDRLRQRQQAVRQLAQAQEHGRVVRQQLATAQLQTIQARVDPQLLFDMLAAVKRFYERDPQRAEQMLDDLAAFLRAALPRLRSARSTLEIEFALVQSYVRLLRWCGDAPVELDIRQPEALATARFPAGMLLPLLVGPATAARCITLEARVQETVLHIQLNDTRAPAGAVLDRLRQSLHGLYGERGRLQVWRFGAGAQIELELPLELA